MAAGWIKLNRRMLEWEHYRNNNAVRVFVHLLLLADYATGEAVATTRGMASDLGMTHKAVRIALEALKASGEIVQTTAGRFGTAFRVAKWGEYQGHKEGHKEGHNLGHTEITEYKKDSDTDGHNQGHNLGHNLGHTISTRSTKNIDSLSTACARVQTPSEAADAEDERQAEALRSLPRYPQTPEEVVALAERGGRRMTREQAENFLGFYAPRGWTIGGTPIRALDWLLVRWINREQEHRASGGGSDTKGNPRGFSGDYSRDVAIRPEDF